jgi:iron complex outermembrane recepter protein
MLLLGGASLFVATGAWAADDAVDAAAADADAVQVEELVVTARRRDETVQSVPIAINAIGERQLEATRTYNLRDLQTQAPSLVVTTTNPRNTSINIRGLGNNVSVYNDGLEPAVGVYLDQVYLARPGATVFDLADLDRVEVLRGPQGTLFGKNTSAGAVSISTKAPQFDFGAGGDVSVGDYGYLQGHAYITGAIVPDKAAFRLSLGATERGGFVENVFNGEDVQDYHDFSARAQLLLRPSDKLSVRLIGEYSRQHALTGNSVLVDVVSNYTDGTPFPFNYYARAAQSGYTPLPIDPEARLIDNNTESSYREWQAAGTAIADLDLGSAIVTSVTSYRYWHWLPHNDADSTSLAALLDSHQDNFQKQFSQELRLASTGTRAFDYVVGLYYMWQDIDAVAPTIYGPQAAGWFVAPSTPPAIAAAALNNYSFVGTSSPVTKSYAAFGQSTWHITPRLDLTTGLRYTYETKSGFFDQVVTGGVDLSTLPADVAAAAQAIRNRFGVANSYTAETSAGRLSGQVNLAYKFTADHMGYVTYARGYKFGGLNLANIVTTGANAVDPVIRPETIDNYEFGLKTSWFDRRLTANLAAFWTDDSDFQTTVIDLSRNNISYLTNVGKVRSRGVEIDVKAAPAEGLTLYGSLTYDDAYYVSYQNAPCPIEIRTTGTCDLSGARLPGVSKWAASAGGEYGRNLEVGGRPLQVYVGGDVYYRSSFYGVSNDSAYSLIDGYSVANLRLGLRAESGGWDASVWARNVFDKGYFVTLSPANTGAVTGILGDPRTVGVTLRARY